jgi:hypothetical protein
MGHALGLSVVSTTVEDRSLSILFPESYSAVQRWMADHRTRWINHLASMSDIVSRALDKDEQLVALGVTTTVNVRAKSAFSMMKKMLDMSGTMQCWLPLKSGVPCMHARRIILFPSSLTEAGALQKRDAAHLEVSNEPYRFADHFLDARGMWRRAHC